MATTNAVSRVELPELPIEGGCECGSLRYRITAAPLTFYLCHCTTCQKQSGSAFGASLHVPAEGITLEGPSTTYSHLGGSGRTLDAVFCPSCGDRLTHQVQGGAAIVVKPGTLDDRSWLMPAGHVFTASRQPWVSLPDDGTLLFEGAPDLPALRARWSEMVGRP
ncbi:GFA family protein [Amorphus sp. 3PC139-8]|uniref:GFA family protein n=1 Tax=Amorphus sp. 3PC139-8 TaxID=2735676 RepID=UPI00345DA341